MATSRSSRGRLQRLLQNPELREFNSDQLVAGVARDAVVLMAGLIVDSSWAEKTTEQLDNQIYACSGKGVAQRVRFSVFSPMSTKPETIKYMGEQALEASREHICYCFLPTYQTKLNIKPTIGYPQISATVIPIYAQDLRALVRGALSLVQLYEYKLFRRYIQDKSDPETEFSELGWSQFEMAKSSSTGNFGPIEHNTEHWVSHPLLQEVIGTLDSGRACILIGLSSAGKSVLGSQTLSRQANRGDRVHVANFSRQAGFVSNLHDLLNADVGERQTSFLLDDLQSNPTSARYAVSLISAWRRVTYDELPNLVAICWNDFAAESVEWFDDCKPIGVFAQQVRDKLALDLAGGLSADIINKLKAAYGDDLLLFSLFLKEAKRTLQTPTSFSIAEQVWDDRTSGLNQDECRAAILIVASLGRFDISTPQAFLEHESGLNGLSIQRLVERGTLRRTPGLLSFGHRSLCGLMCDWLTNRNAWSVLAAKSGPREVQQVVLDYLESADSGKALDTLRGLQARVGFKDQRLLNVRAAAIIEVWQAFEAIIEQLEHQQVQDATWGGTPSSAMFAAQAFAEIGNKPLLARSLLFLESCWNSINGQIEVDLTQLKTGSDFVEIRKRMISQDEIEGTWRDTGQSGQNIDANRFHRTWVLGLILGSEALATKPRTPLLQLVKSVESEQLPSGAFYPERVPWCSARVLLGLAACGRSIQTSTVVKATREWLLRDFNDGGAMKDGVWNSGTGDWNSTLETTAMVLIALASVGQDMSEKRLALAKSYLSGNKLEWAAVGREVDAAVAIQAYLKLGGSWDDIAPEVQRLSQWVRGKAIWQSATQSASESLEQSCRAAQIASHLVEIGWDAIRADLPAFLDALATPRVISSTQSPPPPPSASSDSYQADDVCTAVQKLPRISLSEVTVVGAYKRFGEKTRNVLKDRFLQISRALNDRPATQESFLIWAAPGSGKSFFVQEVARALSPRVKYFEINFAKQSKDEVAKTYENIKSCVDPTLVLFDEVDSCNDYFDQFSLLDIAYDPNRKVVFVAIGSMLQGIKSLVRLIESKPKGKDLISRIFPSENNRFEIPQPTVEDLFVIFASQLVAAAAEKKITITDIERLALYYVGMNPTLQLPRPIRILAHNTIARMEDGETRVRYGHLFDRHDKEMQSFWTKHVEAAQLLADTDLPLSFSSTRS